MTSVWTLENTVKKEPLFVFSHFYVQPVAPFMYQFVCFQPVVFVQHFRLSTTFIFLFLISNRGPPQEEAPAPTNSSDQRHHLPPTHTQGPSRLSLRYPHQRSPWSSPCRPRQLCHSMQLQQHSSLPPSLNATHLFRLCTPVHPLNATMLQQQQLRLLPAVEVKFLFS